MWYFFSWPWALIPGTVAIYTAIQSISATLIAIKLREQIPKGIIDIVQAYGKEMENAAAFPGTVLDVKSLPYPKEDIKTAIIIALKNTDDTQMCEFLKVGYVQLADWQEGVGSTRENIGYIPTDIDITKNIDSFVDTLLVEDINKELREIAQRERESLLGELKALGY